MFVVVRRISLNLFKIRGDDLVIFLYLLIVRGVFEVKVEDVIWFYFWNKGIMDVCE